MRVQFYAPRVMLLFFWFYCHDSIGAYSNYNSVLIGSRAAGLAGAFSALSGDPSASPFYNPATTILMPGNSLSAAVNVYNKYETNVGEAGDFSDAPQRINQGYFRSLPSASSSILGFKSFSFGLSILVPDYDFYSGQVKGSGGTVSFLHRVDESLWAGTTFSARLTEKDGIGFSLYYTARSFSRTVSDRVSTGGGTGSIVTNEEKQITANSLVPILGYHRKLSETWSFGVAYRPPSLPIAGEGTYYKATTTTSPFSTVIINRGNLRAITKIPAKFSFGFAREIKNTNTLSIDLQFYEGLAYRDLPEVSEGADQIEHRPVMNFAIGYEEILQEWLTIRFGVFSNLSSHRNPDAALGVRQGTNVDMSGFSANMTILTPQKTSFTFGGYYSAGTGQATEFIGQKIATVQESQQVFTMLVATGFAF